MISTELIAQSLIAGIVIGIIYALMALGITFIYSIVKMINWAMGGSSGRTAPAKRLSST
jgi:branched-chain amino acid transport system permease protein